MKNRLTVILVLLIITSVALVVSAISMFIGSFEQNLLIIFGSVAGIFIVILAVFIAEKKKARSREQ